MHQTNYLAVIEQKKKNVDQSGGNRVKFIIYKI